MYYFVYGKNGFKSRFCTSDERVVEEGTDLDQFGAFVGMRIWVILRTCRQKGFNVRIREHDHVSGGIGGQIV